jgi:hypothetical protein
MESSWHMLIELRALARTYPPAAAGAALRAARISPLAAPQHQ